MFCSTFCESELYSNTGGVGPGVVDAQSLFLFVGKGGVCQVLVACSSDIYSSGWLLAVRNMLIAPRG